MYRVHQKISESCTDSLEMLEPNLSVSNCDIIGLVIL